MRPSLILALLLIGTTMFTSVSKAQYGYIGGGVGGGFGYGMYPGMQACQWPNGPADGASDEEDELDEVRQSLKDLRGEKRDTEASLRGADRKLNDFNNNIRDVVHPLLADRIIAHMEQGKDCSICKSSDVDVVVRPPAPVPVQPVQPLPPPPLPPRPQPQPKPQPPPINVPVPNDVKSSFMFDSSKEPTRLPATSSGDGLMELAAPVETSSTYTVQDTVEDYSFMGGGPTTDTEGGGPLCYPNKPPYNMQAWRRICMNGGEISADVCTGKNYQKRAFKSYDAAVYKCQSAVRSYNQALRERERLSRRLGELEGLMADFEYRKTELQAEVKEARRERKDEMEACLTGECTERKPRRAKEEKSPSLVPLVAGIGMGLLAEYMGYRGTKKSNELNAQLGWQAQPYYAGSFGFPYAMAGLYGYLGGGVNGGFGCGMGMGGMPGAFGYPPGMMGMPMGGGMYMPGYGPMMGGGMPWGGMAGGMAGGMFGGMPYGGMYGGMAGGMFGGMPYGGMAGGMAGGMPYGGMFGGMAGGMPYGGMAGGMAGGMPYGGMFGGMAGGMPWGGMAGGMAGGMPWGGMAGGMAGGMPYGGMFGGMAGGMPYGGMAGGMAGGMDMGYQQQLMNMQMQQYQMQMQMAQKYQENQMARTRMQMGLMQEYYSLMYRFQQLNTGFGGTGGLGLDMGGGGGAYTPIGGGSPGVPGGGTQPGPSR